MQEDQPPTDSSPFVCHADGIPRSFFGHVARPDDDELREGDVGPEHRQGEQQRPHVMEDAGNKEITEWAVPTEFHQQPNG